jgi:crossover junction endodeoxyribonuclease RuvC
MARNKNGGDNMILGIDGSLSSTGWCVHDGNTVIAVGKIVTKNKAVTKKNSKKEIVKEYTEQEKQEEEDRRIMSICEALIGIGGKYNIDAISMEGQFVGGIESKKTALQLSRLRGAIMIMFKLNNIPIKYISPPTVKKIITGKGNCDKEVVANMIITMYHNNPIVKNIGPFIDKQCKDKTSDIYDAIGIAASYYL